jgi:hypothetical protein
VLDVERLTAVTETFKQGDWTQEIIVYSTNSDTFLSSKATKFAADKVAASLSLGHAGRAFNWAFLLVQWTKGAILNEERFCELFRPTKHELHASKLSSVLKRLGNQAAAHGLKPASESILSWASFCDLFIEVSKVEKGVLDAIRRTPRALAWLASYVEEAFAFEAELAHLTCVGKRHRFDLSKEESASAVSYLLGRYFHRWGIAESDFPLLRQPAEPPRNIEEILLRGHALVEVRGMEPSVFRFGSRCAWVNSSTVEVSHPNDTIDISLELGYIKTQGLVSNAFVAPESGQLTFGDVCDRFERELSPSLVRYATDGSPRLQIVIPQQMARVLTEGVIMASGLFAEEKSEFISTCWEFSTTPEELAHFQVTPGLTLINLLQIGRLFRLLAMVRNEHLEAMRDSDPVCYWNSMLGGIPSKDGLVKLLASAGIPSQMAEEYVSLFVWRPTESSRPLDMQYTSFLPFGSRVAIPFNVHASSNALRNSLMLRRVRLYEDGSVDPLSRDLHDALVQRTSFASTTLRYSWNGVKSDVDSIALLDDCLYVFECKNTLLPCSAFERRTLWDYLQKAVEQLDQFFDALGIP